MMEKNFLEKFFYYGILPREQKIPKNPDYSQAVLAVESLEKELKEHLSQDHFTLFERYKQEHAAIETYIEANRFICGWKMGSQFTFATFLEDNA